MNSSKPAILIVDSDVTVQKMMGIILNEAEFRLEECLNGKSALRLIMSLKPDLILLDLDLPDMEGRDLITAIREWSETPIIILTARAKDKDVVGALDLGANDYVTKPFNGDVLLARIHAALRSSATHETGKPKLSNGPLLMDLVCHEVFLNQKLLNLTPKEYALLRYFMIHTGKMLSHRDILREVWGESHCEDVQYLRVFIGQLRGKIETGSINADFIKTEPGIGYRMEFADLVARREQQFRSAL